MIDDKSLEILKILQEKARIPNVEVSRQVGLAPSAVLERIRKLEKNGIIDGYEVRLNPEQFDKGQIAFIQIQTNCGGEEFDLIGEHLSQLPEIQEVHYTTGDDGFFVKVRVKDSRELGELLRTRITTLSGVAATRTITVMHTVKETSKIPIC